MVCGRHGCGHHGHCLWPSWLWPSRSCLWPSLSNPDWFKHKPSCSPGADCLKRGYDVGETARTRTSPDVGETARTRTSPDVGETARTRTSPDTARHPSSTKKLPRSDEHKTQMEIIDKYSAIRLPSAAWTILQQRQSLVKLVIMQKQTLSLKTSSENTETSKLIDTGGVDRT